MNEISYTIEKQSDESKNYTIICLSESNLTLTQWRSLAKSMADKDALNLLLKEELSYQQQLNGRTPHAESLKFHKIHVAAAQSIVVLQALADTQKLYFNGKLLVADFYGRAEFYYQAEKRENQTLELTGRLKWRDIDIPLSECNCIGSGKPNWFIRGILLKLIAPNISWKKLYQLYQAPLVLEGPQKSAFLEEIDPEDSDSPKLILKDVTLEEMHQGSDPLPILMLKDRSGAFADLWMDYGQDHKILMHDPKSHAGIKRQTNAENNWEKDLLETAFVRKQTGSSHYYCPTDKVAKSLAFLLEIGWSIIDWKNQRVIKQESIDLNMAEDKQAIIINGKVKFTDYEADLSSVFGAFNRRERFVQLSADTVGLISFEKEFRDLQEIAEEGELVGQSIKVKKNRIGTLSSLFEQTEATPSLLKFREKIQNFAGIAEALPSPDFIGQLRPYQQQGVNWLSFLHEYGLSGILADDMGLGKTVQTLAFLSRLPQNQPHLIVMPTSLLFNWKKEIEHFLPHMPCKLHQGADRGRSLAELSPYSIILTSYTTLRMDFSLLKEMNYECIILDEAQLIKNSQTQTAQAAYGLNGQFRLCITGTPIENRLSELWSQFRFLMPDLLGSLESFEADLQAGSSDKRYFDRIKRKIAPFILRRSKQEVLKDLPPRIDQLVWLDMSNEQRQVYERFLAGYKTNLLKKVDSEGLGKHRMEVLEAILRLRQICCHPLLVSTLMDEDEALGSSKFEAIEQDLETIVSEGRKALIYSQFTSMLKLMAQLAKTKGWSYGYLDGSTQNREQTVEEFQKNPLQSLFFISLKAGGVGLNLTAADYVLIYDPWWNEAVEEQAINRAHRIGREDVVIAKRYIIADSIEEKMMKLKAMKRLAIEEMLEEGASPSNLTIEDLHYLFE